jgi:hypothetical protein
MSQAERYALPSPWRHGLVEHDKELIFRRFWDLWDILIQICQTRADLSPFQSP